MDKLILIVDDEEDLRDLFSQVVGAAGFKTKTASGGIEAIALLDKNVFAAILTDIRMPKGDGVELLKNIKQNYPQLPVYIMSGYNDFSVQELLNMGAEQVFTKPFNYEDLLNVLREKICIN